MATFRTTAEKRKLRAQAEFEESLAPKGAKPSKTAGLDARRAKSTQTIILGPPYHRDLRLHTPDCWVLDEDAAKDKQPRRATDEELATHQGCGHCG